MENKIEFFRDIFDFLPSSNKGDLLSDSGVCMIQRIKLSAECMVNIVCYNLDNKNKHQLS